MHTVILQNKPRKSPQGTSILIEVIGESPIKDAIKASIDALENHPAKASRRSIIDMLGIIEKHNLRICYTEHFVTEDDLEGWTFVLQG